jgi:branched-chain amino acid aminotransferase
LIGEPHPELAAWIDGEFVPWRAANVHVTAHHYGVGVFEGLRAYAGHHGIAIFRLADHTARLFRSSKILGIPIPAAFGPEQLDAVQCELVARNRLESAYIRPFVFYDGAAGIGLHTGPLSVRVAVVALPWRDDGAHLDPTAKARGIRLRTSSFRRNHPGSVFSKAKANGNYMSPILALAEARSSGADDALLLDHDGFVTETSGANLFIVRGGVLITPPSHCVLEGITRRTLFELASEHDGVTVREARLTRDDVYTADEVFLTGTAAEVTPVREVDGRLIGDGTRGSVTSRLQELYGALVRGRVGFDRGWLTSVEGPRGHLP